ncbi:MAG: hypothetical protein U1E61_18920 [Bradyrhizobium sp.]
MCCPIGIRIEAMLWFDKRSASRCSSSEGKHELTAVKRSFFTILRWNPDHAAALRTDDSGWQGAAVRCRTSPMRGGENACVPFKVIASFPWTNRTSRDAT